MSKTVTLSRRGGVWLRGMRDHLGLSQAEMGRRIGVSARSVGRFEHGAPIPYTVELAVKWIRAKAEERGEAW